MNRLKFRAWVRNTAHRLVRNTPLGTGSHWEEGWAMAEVLTIHLNKQKARCRYEKDGSLQFQNGVIVDVHDYKIGEDCILMQWTGMRDKNNKDIYEGDVLEVARPNGTSYLAKVSWDHIGWSPFMYSGGGETESSDCKVVGNIHENKEYQKL